MNLKNIDVNFIRQLTGKYLSEASKEASKNNISLNQYLIENDKMDIANKNINVNQIKNNTKSLTNEVNKHLLELNKELNQLEVSEEVVEVKGLIKRALEKTKSIMQKFDQSSKFIQGSIYVGIYLSLKYVVNRLIRISLKYKAANEVQRNQIKNIQESESLILESKSEKVMKSVRNAFGNTSSGSSSTTTSTTGSGSSFAPTNLLKSALNAYIKVLDKIYDKAIKPIVE